MYYFIKSPHLSDTNRNLGLYICHDKYLFNYFKVQDNTRSIRFMFYDINQFHNS